MKTPSHRTPQRPWLARWSGCVGVLVCGYVLGACARTPQTPPDLQQNPYRPRAIHLTIGDYQLLVEYSETESERALGLMFREQMGENQGMWFAFPDSDFRKFYMKNTRIPLDIAFVDSEGVITNIEQMRPFQVSPGYYSTRRTQFALEMNQGWFAHRKIKPGNRIIRGEIVPHTSTTHPLEFKLD